MVPVTLLTIGQLARRSGVPVRTLRFWSDAGVLPETERSGSNYRRYDARGLRQLFTAAGLEVLDSSYLDPIGVVPYWVYFRLLNRASFSTGSVKVFDNAYVPLIRAIRATPLGRLPGKTVVCVGRSAGPTPSQ